MNSKRSSPSSCDPPADTIRSGGFSLIELLVGLSVMVMVTSIALGLATSSRRIYAADTARAAANDGVRATADLVTTDLRQAGERLPDDFPAIEIIDGSGGAPDELIVRRNLLDTVLRVCRDLTATSAKIYITELVASPAPVGCTPVDLDGDGWVDTHKVWRDWRRAHGGNVRAFVFDPVTGAGDFFTYRRDSKTNGFIRRSFVPALSTNYPLANQPRVYMIEERRYRLQGDILQAVIDGDAADVQQLVPNVTDFGLQARFRDGTTQTALGFADVWSDLEAIEVSVAMSVPHGDTFVDRTRSFEVLPRNVLSR